MTELLRRRQFFLLCFRLTRGWCYYRCWPWCRWCECWSWSWCRGECFWLGVLIWGPQFSIINDPSSSKRTALNRDHNTCARRNLSIAKCLKLRVHSYCFFNPAISAVDRLSSQKPKNFGECVTVTKNEWSCTWARLVIRVFRG